jgi:hypothetical protein
MAPVNIQRHPGRPVTATSRQSVGKVIALLMALLPQASIATEATPPSCGDTLVWLSIDGVKPADLAAASTPFLDRLQAEGLYSNRLQPAFPSLTFSSHAAMATGASAAIHGITGNVFRDRTDKAVHAYPQPQALLRAEPIWTTATRQKQRSLVYDWPLSHAQDGPFAAAYFHVEFRSGVADERRLDTLLEAWRSDEEASPLRLLMGYVSGADSAGHRAGPGASAVRRALERTDASLSRFHAEALRIFRERRCGPDSAFWLLISSDHGMTAATRAVHPRRLAFAGRDTGRDVEIVSSGPLANLHFPEGTDHRQHATVRRLRSIEGVRAWRRSELPPSLEYGHPDRSGDVVILLPPGEVFSFRASGQATAAHLIGLRGMHGHDSDEVPAMQTILRIHRQPPLPKALRGMDLGKVDARRLHATAAALLGIVPAESAHPTPLLRLDAGRPHATARNSTPTSR